MPLMKHPAAPRDANFGGAVFGKGGGSSAPPAPTSSQVTQTNLPEYAEPYYLDMMDRAQTASLQPYQTYEAPRLADFTAEQEAAMANITNLSQPGQIGLGSNIAAGVGDFQANQIAPGYSGTGISAGYGGSNIAAGYGGANIAAQYGGTGITRGYGGTSAFTGGSQGGYGGTTIDRGYAGQGTFDPGRWSVAERDNYMNPYIDAVLDRTQRRAIERYNEDQLARDFDATRAGAFGGNRRGVADELARREVNERLTDIEAQEYANAYRNAQQMFTSDAARSLQAQGMGDASLAAADNRFIQAQIASDASRARADEMGLRAQLAADASLTAADQRGIQAQIASDASRAQADERFLRGQIATDTSRTEADRRALQAQIATDTSLTEADRRALQAQIATDTSLTAADQRFLQGQIASEEARRGAANLQLDAAQQLGGLGALSQEAALQRYGAQMGVGDARQQLEQASLDIGYTDFINQRDYERQQLNWLNSVLRGVPVSAQSEVTQYQQPPNDWNTLMGLGIGGLGLARELNR